MCTVVSGYAGWELGEEDGGNYERDHVGEVAEDQRPSPTGTVNEEDGAELSDQRDNAVDGLVLECVVARDADLAVNGDGVVLDRRDTCDLD